MNALRLTKTVIAASLMLGLGACASTMERLSRAGNPPELSPIENPTEKRDYKPVSQPMPRRQQPSYSPNSLWRSDAKQFFRDQRAKEIGDILTVEINITDSARLANSSSRARTSAEDSDITNFFGLEGGLGTVFNDAVNPGSLVSLGNDSSTSGTGSIDRTESVSLTVAAVVMQTLPNGNLVIQGKQEVRVNYEVRQLMLTGIVRPQDISSSNKINHTQIAEARISYGGRGHISDVQKPRWGQELYDILFPY